MRPEVLFGTTDPAVLAEKADRFVQTMEKMAGGELAPDVDSGGQVFKASGWNNPAVRALSMFAEGQALNKALAPDLLSQVQAQLADVQKDLTPTSPLATGYVAYDLKPAIEQIRFAETPLRNRITRSQGHGKGYQIKQITGHTGAISPTNVGVFHPGIVDSTQTRFDNPGSANGLYYNRPKKISYAGAEVNFPYVQMGASDELSWSTQFTALGFTDLRAMSRTTLMLADMLLEERLLLTGRGTQTGYSGALAAPAIASITARNPAAGETALSLSTNNMYVKATSDAGEFGESVPSAASTQALASGKVYDVVVTDVVGALGYRVYASFGASDPGDASRWYVGRTGYNTYTIQGTVPSAGAVPPASDTSAYSAGYDGIIPTCLGSGAGYVNRVNGPLSTVNPGVEFQTAFAAMWDLNRARPNRLMFAGSDFKQLNESIRNGGSGTSYRLTVGQPDVHGVTVGNIISAIINETGGTDVIPEVHPFMPQGVVPILTDHLPMPSQGVTDIWEVRNVQDTLAIEWPVMQLSYDASTYRLGTFVCHAPGYQGAVAGIRKV